MIVGKVECLEVVKIVFDLWPFGDAVPETDEDLDNLLGHQVDWVNGAQVWTPSGKRDIDSRCLLGMGALRSAEISVQLGQARLDLALEPVDTLTKLKYYA